MTNRIRPEQETPMTTDLVERIVRRFEQIDGYRGDPHRLMAQAAIDEIGAKAAIPSPDIGGLVERLMRSVTDTTAFCPSPVYRNPDGPEAADTISTLYADLERAKEALRKIADGRFAHGRCATCKQECGGVTMCDCDYSSWEEYPSDERASDCLNSLKGGEA